MSNVNEIVNIVEIKNNMDLKNLIFDVGDVLLSYRWKDMLMDYGLKEDDAIRVGTEMFEDPEKLWHVFDLGTKSDEEIIEAFCQKYPDDAEEIRWFIIHGEFMHVPRPEVYKSIKTLKEQGYGIYILSNYPESLFKKHLMYSEVLDYVDGMMVSYMINEAKPDAVIYEALCKKYNLKPEECLFFDDRLENVKGAKACGIEAIQVKSREQIARDLEKLIKA